MDDERVINPNIIKWFQGRGISEGTVRDIGIYSGRRHQNGVEADPKGNLIVFPFLLNNKTVNGKRPNNQNSVMPGFGFLTSKALMSIIFFEWSSNKTSSTPNSFSFENNYIINKIEVNGTRSNFFVIAEPS